MPDIIKLNLKISTQNTLEYIYPLIEIFPNLTEMHIRNTAYEYTPIDTIEFELKKNFKLLENLCITLDLNQPYNSDYVETYSASLDANEKDEWPELGENKKRKASN